MEASYRAPDTSLGPGAQGEELVRELYAELRRIARREYARGGSPVTLQPTALIGEAYLKMKDRAAWASEGQFLGCAATAMRHIMVDAARARLAVKRSGQRESITSTLRAAAAPEHDEQVVHLSEVLGALAVREPELAKLVEYRFFVGLDEVETARLLGVTDRTVRRWWTRARAWIHSEMTAET